MTREEAIETIKDICLTTEQLTRIENALECLLSHPSLPSNLDEAAENCTYCEHAYARESFKEGAEWMAGQFQKIEGDLVDWYSTTDGKDYCGGISTNDTFEVPEGFYIRKK